MKQRPKLSSWKNYKFHCSSLPALMTNGRSAGEGLSETTKTALREIWIKERFGREKFDSINKYTEKGIAVESDSLELYGQAVGKNYFKNKTTLGNSYLIGTPDHVKPLIDIKSSWDMFTFFAVDEKKANKDYYWQLVGYMVLTRSKKATLAYVLSNTPDYLIEYELYTLSRKIGIERAESDEARRNFVFDDLPVEQRVKRYEITYNKTDADAVRLRVKECRAYLAELDRMHL